MSLQIARVFSMLAAGGLVAGALAGPGAATAAPLPVHHHQAGHRRPHVKLAVRRSLRVVRVRHVRVVHVHGTTRRARVVPWQAPARLASAATAGPAGRGAGHATLLAAMSGGGGVQEFTVPTSGSMPLGVAVTPDPQAQDGDAWFVESSGSKIGEVTPAGSFTEYPIPSEPNYDGGARAIAAGPDGNLWFTTYSYIWRMTPARSFTFFPITAYNWAYDITAGPDGNMWFTELGGKVGSVSMNGAVTEYSVGSGIYPQYITGMGGSLWFTATGGGSNYVYQMTTSGSLTQYVLPSGWSLGDISAGPDGRVWFGSSDTALTAMSPDGSYTTYTWSVGSPNGYSPQYLRPDASGAMVFATSNDGSVGQMTTSGSVSFTAVPSGNGANGLAVAPDGAIWFSEENGNKIGLLPGGPGQFPPTVPAGQTYGCACGTSFAARPQDYAGAGINTATGAFSTAFTAAQLPGPGPAFSFGLAYTSADTASGPLGPGWTDSYQAGLSFGGSGNATFTTGVGQQIPFTASGGAYSAGPGIYASLAAISGGYQVAAPDGTQLNFNSSGQLTSETDRSGAGVTLSYSGGQLASATDTGGRTVTFGYNSAGLLSALTMPDGRSVSYGYTGGQLTSVTGLGGGETQFGYNTAGQLTTITDPDNHTVLTNTYDPDTGRVTSQTDGDGNTTTFSWNPETQVATTTSPAGITATDTYNNNVLISHQDFPVAGYTYYSYDNNLDVTQVTDPDGNRTEMTYDSAGNMLSETAPAPLYYKQTWTYNSMNEVLTATDGLQHTTTYGYDADGNLTSVTDPQNHQWAYTYYGDGQVKTATDPDGNQTSYTYDGHDDLATVKDPAGNTTSYGYDADGNPTSETDPSSQTWNATYDHDGNLTSITDPLGDQTSYGYDADGQLTSITDPDNNTATAAYDHAGNLTSTTTAAGKTTSYTYNSDNQVATVTDPDGNLTKYTYLNNGWLSSITQPDGMPIGLDYYTDGRLFAYLDPDGNTTRYYYDPLGRLTSITDPTDNSTQYGYDAASNLTSTTSPGGLVTSYGHDPENRLTSVAYSDGTTHGVGYGYDDAGLLTSMTDGTGTTSYSYNPDGQLTATTCPPSLRMSV